VNPLAAIVLILLLIGIFSRSRLEATAALVIGVLCLGQNATMDIAGMNFFPVRILGWACFFRVLLRKEFSFSQLTRTDNAFIVLYVFTTLVLLLREPETAALRVAKMLDNLFTYFALRGLVRSPEELKSTVKFIGLALIPFVILLTVERTTGQNLFVYLGHPGKIWLREGAARCFGSFRHPSLLGSVGACFLPLFIGLAFDPAVRKRAILGCVLCLAIVGFSNSGGPASVAATAMVGWGLWRFRARMRAFRRGLVFTIIALALVMKAPIWYLPSKVSSFTGGSGWHRSRLMEVAYQHLNEWWLVGMPVEETAGWMPYNLGATGGADITNQFLAFGLSAGLAGMALFIYLLYRGFSGVGQALQKLREDGKDRREEAFLWGLGVALAAHVTNWLGITYFDQFNVLWLLQFAGLVTLSEFYLRESAPVAEETPEVGAPGSDQATAHA